MSAIDFGTVRVLTFDCYGTLIDWEVGISAAFGAIFRAHGQANPPTYQLLEAYARAEAQAETGPFLPYRDVLRLAAQEVCVGFGIGPTESELAAFAGSVADWPAFPDSAAALARLRTRFRLGVITNCDDDLFAASSARLGDPFEWVVTAQQARAYKPALTGFELAFARIGLPRGQIVHVAQSLYHDHVPAARLRLKSVWVDRRHDQAGSGATPPAAARPTLTVTSMASLADAALGR